MKITSSCGQCVDEMFIKYKSRDFYAVIRLKQDEYIEIINVAMVLFAAHLKNLGIVSLMIL